MTIVGGVIHSWRLFKCLCCGLDSKRSHWNLFFYFVPCRGLVFLVCNIKQCIIYPWERLSCIFIMAAWSKDDVSGGREAKKQQGLEVIHLGSIHSYACCLGAFLQCFFAMLTTFLHRFYRDFAWAEDSLELFFKQDTRTCRKTGFSFLFLHFTAFLVNG